jgi:hypothetical protein
MGALAAGLSAILGERLLGIYLAGSLPMGDFSEVSSDLDFLVVTAGPLSRDEADRIGALHERLREHYPLGDRLEGDYAPLGLLVPEGTIAPVPGCEAGIFLPEPEEIMLSADNIWNVREYGVTIYGWPPEQILPEVTPDQFRASVRAMLLEGPGDCPTAAKAASEVLDLTRSLCSLEMGQPTTKSAGAAWALAHLDERWHRAIRAALAIRRGEGTEEDERLVLATLPEMARALRPPES